MKTIRGWRWTKPQENQLLLLNIDENTTKMRKYSSSKLLTWTLNLWKISHFFLILQFQQEAKIKDEPTEYKKKNGKEREKS